MYERNHNLTKFVLCIVYVPPLPQSLVELKERISAAVQTIDRTVLQNAWNELDYRLDLCRGTY